MKELLLLTTIQVTFVFKEEWADEDVKIFMMRLRASFRGDDLFVDILLNERSTKEVEV